MIKAIMEIGSINGQAGTLTPQGLRGGLGRYFLLTIFVGPPLIKEKWAQMSTKEAFEVARLAVFVQAPCLAGLSLPQTYSRAVSGEGVSRLTTACPQTT